MICISICDRCNLLVEKLIKVMYQEILLVERSRSSFSRILICKCWIVIVIEDKFIRKANLKAIGLVAVTTNRFCFVLFVYCSAVRKH
jgi:hypothetical protein